MLSRDDTSFVELTSLSSLVKYTNASFRTYSAYRKIIRKTFLIKIDFRRGAYLITFIAIGAAVESKPNSDHL